MPILDNAHLFQFSVLLANPKKFQSLVYKELYLDPKARTLDVCCGTGNFSGLIEGEYLGVDLNKDYIAFARRRYRNYPSMNFTVADINDLNFKPKYYDNVMLISALHHLPDESVSKILEKINMTARGRIIITDPAIEDCNPVSRLLISLDRGKFVRPLEGQLNLIQKSLDIVKHFTFYTGLAHIRMIVCQPKGEGNGR